MKRLLRTGSAALLLLSASACDSKGYGRKLPEIADAVGTSSLEDALLFVRFAKEEQPHALVVDVSGSEARLHDYALPEASDVQTLSRPSSGGRETLVMTQGRAPEFRAHAYDTVPANLSIFNRSGERSRYELPGRFQRLSVSDDGRFALAFAPPDDPFSSQNSVSVVDMAKSPEDEKSVTGGIIRTNSGAQPDAFLFSPSAQKRRLALGLLSNMVILVALEDTRRVSTMSLVAPEDTSTLVPHKAVFATQRIYVQVDGSSKVFGLQLDAADDTTLDYGITPFQLSLSSPVQDLIMFGSGASERLVALGHDEVAAFDSQGEPTANVPFNGEFSSLLMFHGRSPEDEEVRPRLLLWGPSDHRVGFLDLEADAGAVEPEVEFVDLDDSLESVLLVDSRALAIGLHGSGRLSLIDLADRTVSPISSGGVLQSTLLDEEHGRLWVLTDDGTLGSVSLDSFAGSPLVAGDDARDLLLVPGKSPHVALVHDYASGHVTLLDARHPTRASAREFVGFLWSGLFD